MDKYKATLERARLERSFDRMGDSERYGWLNLAWVLALLVGLALVAGHIPAVPLAWPGLP